MGSREDSMRRMDAMISRRNRYDTQMQHDMLGHQKSLADQRRQAAREYAQGNMARGTLGGAKVGSAFGPQGALAGGVAGYGLGKIGEIEGDWNKFQKKRKKKSKGERGFSGLLKKGFDYAKFGGEQLYDIMAGDALKMGKQIVQDPAMLYGAMGIGAQIAPKMGDMQIGGLDSGMNGTLMPGANPGLAGIGQGGPAAAPAAAPQESLVRDYGRAAPLGWDQPQYPYDPRFIG